MKCIIIGAGEFKESNIIIGKDDLVICADGGYHYAKMIGIIPDYLVGDFDSIENIHIDESIKQIKLSPIKDETDIYMAIQIAIEKGCNEFYIYGALGGRLAHTYANIQILYYLKQKNIKAILYNNNEIVEILHNESVSYSNIKGFISLFSYTPSSIISIKNLKYELDRKEIFFDFPLGLDNEFMNEESSITIHEGYVLSIINKK